MNCSHCGHGNQRGAENCGRCGSPLNGSTQVCTNGHHFAVGESRCPYCPDPELTRRIAGEPVAGGGADKTVVMGGGADKTVVMPGGKPAPASASPSAARTMIMGAADKTKSGGGNSSSEMNTGRRLRGWLVSFSWNEHGDDWRLREGRNRIGSAAANDIVLKDATVSDHHATLLCRKETIVIQDHLSSNGTLVNGESIDKIDLEDGDEIRIGQTSLKIRLV